MHRRYRPFDLDHRLSHNYASIHRQLAEENLLAKLAREPSKQDRHRLESEAFRAKGE